MSVAPPSRACCRAKRGSALVIVLLFVILLTALTVAFLARSLTAVKVSASSSGETKASLLANSAGDIIIGDMKQEIIAGSAPNAGTAVWPIYIPATNNPAATPPVSPTMIPFQNGIPTSGTAIPNMTSRSVSPSNTGGAASYVPYNASYYTASQTPPNRAATDASALNPTFSTTAPYTTSKVNSSRPSLNGRYISPAQWNSHYLIPRDPTKDAAGSTSADSTPVPSFVPPDWVIVTRGGAKSVAWSSGSGGLNDPTLSNANYAVGRYAYTIYNEGGLLDMNVAGYPADTTAGGPNGLTTTQISKKGSLALADLTQLTAGATSITQAQVNSIVGWRNYASSQLTASNGSYPNFNFTAATASNWLTNFVMGNTNGFLQVVSSTTPPTDQAFLSRQQLITLTQSLGMSPDFLQYMGTFSRALEQPSYNPDPNRPMILTTGGAPPAYTSADSYAGNNDVEGGDASANPSLLTKRAPGSWPTLRYDGTAAVSGEPLIKEKFPLSWLSMVTYNATAAKTATDPIYRRFGISRSNPYGPWTYNHGAAKILTLTQVASVKREPDFAELLKAVIVSGSLGKAGPNLHNNQYNYQYVEDYSVDTQVIQIMANLIDQQDADSYPTVITINNNTVYGVEDLPYFYRYHLMSVVDKLPKESASPFSNKLTQTFTAKSTDTTTGTLSGPSKAVNYLTGATQAATWTLTNTAPGTIQGLKQTTLTDPGEVTLLYIPDLWNPHDPNTALATGAANRPTQFRLYAATDDPIGSTAPYPSGGTPPWQVGAESEMVGSGDKYDGSTPPNLIVAGLTRIIPEKDDPRVSPARHRRRPRLL